MARHVFYSFHYVPDNWRVSQIRNIGSLDGNKAAHDNDWETVTKAGDAAIQRWIQTQMKGRSCTPVLIGAQTAGRKWINYEITESWKAGKGVAGIHIHKLLDRHQRPATKGANPFSGFTLSNQQFDQIVRAYDPPGYDSKSVYRWIADNVTAIIDEALAIRSRY